MFHSSFIFSNILYGHRIGYDFIVFTSDNALNNCGQSVLKKSAINPEFD